MTAQVITIQDVKTVGNKVCSVSEGKGNVNYNIAKYYYSNAKQEFVVITRKGLSDFICHPLECIAYVGTQGVHFKTFKTAKATAGYINNLLKQK